MNLLRTIFRLRDPHGEKARRNFPTNTDALEQLYRLVHQSNLTVVYGRAGLGKTRLVRQGLAGRFAPADWFAVYVLRGENINDSLLTSLDQDQQAAPANGTLEERLRQRRDLRGRLSYPSANGSSEEPVVSAAVLRLRALYEGYFKPVFLIVDQLEELFIHGKPEEQELFFRTLAEILTTEAYCHVILVLREEWLAALHDYDYLLPMLFDKRLRLRPAPGLPVQDKDSDYDNDKTGPIVVTGQVLAAGEDEPGDYEAVPVVVTDRGLPAGEDDPGDDIAVPVVVTDRDLPAGEDDPGDSKSGVAGLARKAMLPLAAVVAIWVIVLLLYRPKDPEPLTSPLPAPSSPIRPFERELQVELMTPPRVVASWNRTTDTMYLEISGQYPPFELSIGAETKGPERYWNTLDTVVNPVKVARRRLGRLQSTDVLRINVKDRNNQSASASLGLPVPAYEKTTERKPVTEATKPKPPPDPDLIPRSFSFYPQKGQLYFFNRDGAASFVRELKSESGFTIQLNFFNSEENFSRYLNLLQASYPREDILFSFEGKGYRVYLGFFGTEPEARRFLQQLAPVDPDDHKNNYTVRGVGAPGGN